MSDLRTAAQQALEFIRSMNEHGWLLADYESDMKRTVAGLEAALAQEQAEQAWVCPEAPEERTYSKPGYCKNCGRSLVLAQAEPDAYGYASYLAVAIWEKHYKDVAPHWKPLDDLVGVLTQIDNMTAGLTRQEQAEPVAYIHRQGNHWEVSERHLDEDEKARGWTEEPLYTAPPKLVPLTEEEAAKACGASGNLGPLMQIVRAVERALEAKNGR